VKAQSNSARNGLMCVAIFTACYWAAWPVAEMGFIDDWSYIRSAQVFAQTGHFVYNGWATAMLGWQIAWGALFVRLFGFSFMAVKLSTLPLAMAALFLFHAILVRFGCTPRNAVVGCLTLGLSPLFLPLAASYMTDIPGVFVIVLCLYCCQRAVSAESQAAAITWLCAAAASDVVGGTARQIAWLGALVMVPATAIFLRRQRWVLLCGLALWIGSLAAIFCCMHWFGSQPYSLSESISIPSPIVSGLVIGFWGIFGELLCLALVVYPLLMPWLPRLREFSKARLAIVVAILAVWTGFQWVWGWMLPWRPHLLVSEFARARDAGLSPPETSSFFLPTAFRLLLSAVVVATVIALFAARPKNLRLAAILSKRTFWLLGPFSIAYFAILIPRATVVSAFDRYMLGVMPMAIILLIQFHQRRIAPNLPAGSVIALVIYAALAVAGTHDWFAWQRARLAAIDEVLAAGVPRNQIQGGLEYDGWTQTEDGGHVNNEFIRVPPGAYDPNPKLPHVAADCRLEFASLTPDVVPKYTVAFRPKPCLAPSNFPPVEFHAWLPPFSRTIVVQKIPGS
jgi:hypothetical protein